MSAIQVPAAEFTAAVGWAAKWVTARPLVPAQGGIALSLRDGGLLGVGAFSENASVEAVIDIGHDQPESPLQVMVSGRLLAELAGTFAPSRPVTIAVEDGAVVITSGRFVATLPTMEIEHFPKLDMSLPVIGSILGDLLADAVRRVAVTVDMNAAEVPLTSMYLGFDVPEYLTVVGGSRQRAAIMLPSMTSRYAGEGQPRHASPRASVLVDAAAAFADQGEVEIRCDGRVMELVSRARSLTMRLLDLHDPATGRFGYPVDLLTMAFGLEQADTVAVDRTELTGPVKRAATMRGPKGPVRVTLAEGSLTIGAVEGESKRHSDDVIDLDYAGPEITLAVDPDYLSDALKSAPGDRITVRFSTPTQRLVLTCETEPSWRHVLMPMRLR